ncbi:MAG: ParB/RepB/Spo0J family partition protein [candidate division Zixibacteria bacterium]|nr:ParB/RepB/Spo0J family partition protein [candidate division Zixibacteria bacterium]
MHRNALGKGLEALIPEPSQELVKPEKQPEKGLVNLRVDKIKSNPYQPRTRVDEEKLSELSASIKEKGIIQPVVVRPVGEEFELVAGERRFLAAKKLGWEKIPAIITGKLSKEEMLELSLIENLQREDLNPIDTATGYKRLLEECHLSQQQLAQKIGKERSSVANTLRLLNLPREVQKLISSGTLSEGHARAILSLSTEKEKINLSRRVVKEGLSVRKTEDLVYGKKKTSATKQRAKVSPAFFEIEEKLKQFFGTSVKVSGKRKGGKIEIEFYSEEDLSRILELLQITL